jgi:DNA (cytosine-5)-methyltransferase 1
MIDGVSETVAGVPTLDIFSGAGGLSLGLAAAGFSIIAACERNEDAQETFAGHHPHTEFLGGDAEKVDFRRFRGQVELVAGGPPCQPWSIGGKRLGAEDERDGLPTFARAVAEIRPLAFLMENVAGLASEPRRGHLDNLVEALAGLGYQVWWEVLDAPRYGVPQRRRRLFVVGTRKGSFEGLGADDRTCSRHEPTAGDVLSIHTVVGDPNPSPVTYARNPVLRPSPYAGLLFNGGGRPINLSAPAPTVLASMGWNRTPWIDTEGILVDYHRHLLDGGAPRSGRVLGARRITIEEAALLQTFRCGIAFKGTRSSQFWQIGNAVPPNLAEAVGRPLRAVFDDI